MTGHKTKEADVHMIDNASERPRADLYAYLLEKKLVTPIVRINALKSYCNNAMYDIMYDMMYDLIL